MRNFFSKFYNLSRKKLQMGRSFIFEKVRFFGIIEDIFMQMRRSFGRFIFIFIYIIFRFSNWIFLL